MSAKIEYGQIQGVLINDQLFDRQQFEGWFENNLNNVAENMDEFMKVVNSIEKTIQTIKIPKGQSYSITKFKRHFEKVEKLFRTNIFPGLGGTVSLMTTFDMGTSNQTTYFLDQENYILNKETDGLGRAFYLNSRDSIEALDSQINKYIKFNNALTNHLNNFSNQLKSKDLNEEDRIKMHAWAYYNMKKRYYAHRKDIGEGLHEHVSIADYFWGHGYQHGYIQEAFGAHLALKHPKYLAGQATSYFKHGVIEEHGGAGSDELFTLLKSTKGQISSQLSGDIVVIDSNGKIRFNIQSKASTLSNYEFSKTYTKFLNNALKFVDIAKQYLDNQGNLKPSTKKKYMDKLFKVFSTTAWVPIKKNIEKESSKVIEKKIIEPVFKNLT